MDDEPGKYEKLRLMSKDEVHYNILKEINFIGDEDPVYEFRKPESYSKKSKCHWCESEIDNTKPSGFLRLNKSRCKRICKSCFERYLYYHHKKRRGEK